MAEVVMNSEGTLAIYEIELQTLQLRVCEHKFSPKCCLCMSNVSVSLGFVASYYVVMIVSIGLYRRKAEDYITRCYKTERLKQFERREL